MGEFNMRERGRVEWFDRKLGYGFVSRDGSPDVFIHGSKLQEGSREWLEAGDIVEFEVREVTRRNGGKKAQAFEAKLITPVSTSKPNSEETI